MFYFVLVWTYCILTFTSLLGAQSLESQNKEGSTSSSDSSSDESITFKLNEELTKYVNKSEISDQVGTLLHNGQDHKKYKSQVENSAPSDSLQHNGHEDKNGGKKSPIKSPRKGLIKSPTKGYKSPIKRRTPAEANADSTKTELLTTKKDKNGGRAIESNIRSGNAGSASSSHISTKHNIKTDRASTGQWWKVRYQ